MSTSRTRITAMVVALLAAACGGGGDDAAPVTSPYVLITAANQDSVARTSIASSLPFSNLPVPLASPSPAFARTAEAGTAVVLGGHTGIAPLLMRALDFGVRHTSKVPDGMARPLAASQATFTCVVSGNYTVTVDDKDNSLTMTPGDTISIVFNQCDDGIGPIVNGGMALTVATYSQTATVNDLTGSVTFQSLAMTSSAESLSLGGSAAFRFTDTVKSDGYELFTSFTVASGGLTMSRQSATAGLSDTFSYRAGFTVSDRDFSPNVAGAEYSEIIIASGDFGSRVLGGDLTLSTTTPFKSVYTDPTGDIFPSEGQLLVSGRDGTKLRLTATSTIAVLMEVSYDSDAEWEFTKTVDWPWLFGVQ